MHNLRTSQTQRPLIKRKFMRPQPQPQIYQSSAPLNQTPCLSASVVFTPLPKKGVVARAVKCAYIVFRPPHVSASDGRLATTMSGFRVLMFGGMFGDPLVRGAQLKSCNWNMFKGAIAFSDQRVSHTVFAPKSYCGALAGIFLFCRALLRVGSASSL